MLDLKIINGTIVDGTGKPRFQGDIGVREGRIVAMGKVEEEARETVDATDRIVAPGFIDTHTHYDAQVFWEPTLSPSCYHGVTTVFGGFCGFSIAPMSEDAAGYIRPMLAKVEGMPLEALEIALPWGSWSSFGEYLDGIEGKIGLNAGFFCGHSAIRRVVMGDRAVGKEATGEEIEAMKALLDRSLAEGAMGFSTTISETHVDGDNRPVPSRWASHAEIVALGGVVKDHPGTGLELLPDLSFKPGVPELLADFSVAGNRPVNWNILIVGAQPDAENRAKSLLRHSDTVRERGGELIALTPPGSPELYMNFRSIGSWDALPGMWHDIFQVPHVARMAILKDPASRRKLAEDAASMDPANMRIMFARLANYTVISTGFAGHQKYEGRLIGDIAAEEGREAIDVMLDIAVADDLMATFMPRVGGNDRETFELRAKVWRDDRTLVGASDAGAHLDMIATFSFSTTLLAKGVREFGVISLEEAVYQITDRQARYMGLIDRGRLELGYHADIVIFDIDTIAPGRVYRKMDVPGTSEPEARVYGDAIGVEQVFVNGVQIIRDGVHTGRLPGKVLRSGQDTRTVLPGAMREDRQPELA